MRTKFSSQNAGCSFAIGAGGRGSSTWVAAFAAHQHRRTAMPLMKWVWWRASHARRARQEGKEKAEGRSERVFLQQKKSTAKLTMDNRRCRSS